MMSNPSRHPLARDAITGVLWFVGLFIWDAVDSYYRLKRATGRIKTDATTMDAVEGAVLSFVGGAAAAYVFMGLMAGLLLHCIIRVLHSQPPSTKHWLRSAISLLTIGTILGLARQMITFPALYAGYPFRRQWVELAEPSGSMQPGSSSRWSSSGSAGCAGADSTWPHTASGSRSPADWRSASRGPRPRSMPRVPRTTSR